MDKEYNKQLCEKYPFLIPHNAWTGKPIDDYDYSYTVLDEMPDGWRKAFGEQFCEELKQALGEAIEKYYVVQVKEKFGELRWYSNFDTNASWKVLCKYMDLSRRICINCGAIATKISIDWICPWCDECSKEIKECVVPIDEFYEEN